MKSSVSIRYGSVVVVCAASLALAQTRPTAGVPLPRVATPIYFDGNLDEWANAAAIPVRNASTVVSARTTHQWHGPASTGMMFFVQWDVGGLCLAADVVDSAFVAGLKDSVATTTTVRSSIELLYDMREGATAPDTAGMINARIWAPGRGTVTRFEMTNPPGAKLDGVRVVGRRTQRGYSFEMVLPWQSGFVPKNNKQIRLQARLADFITSDSSAGPSLVMTWQTSYKSTTQPEPLTRWRLCDQIKMADSTLLGPMISVDIPSRITGDSTMLLGVDIGPFLAKRAASALFVFTDTTGRPVIDVKADLASMPEPWIGSRIGQVGYSPSALKNGMYLLQVSLVSASMNVVGVRTLPVSVDLRVATLPDGPAPAVPPKRQSLPGKK